MDYTPDVAPPDDELLTVRIDGTRLIDLGGVYVDPCDVIAVAEIPSSIAKPPTIEGSQAQSGITLRGFTNGSVLFSTLTSSDAPWKQGE